MAFSRGDAAHADFKIAHLIHGILRTNKPAAATWGHELRLWFIVKTKPEHSLYEGASENGEEAIVLRDAVKFAATFAFVAFSSSVVSQRANSDPTPIVYDTVSGQWEIEHSAGFGSSGLTLDVRRFAKIPNDSNGYAPRLSLLAYAPGVEGRFVVNAGVSGDATSAAPIYHISPDGSEVSQVLDVGDVYCLPRDGGYSEFGGVRGIAFHPNFDKPTADGFGKVYTTAVVARPSDITLLTYLGPSATSNTADGVLIEWDATFDGTGAFIGIDPGSAREVLRVASPDAQHPIAQAGFNPHAEPSDEDYGLIYLFHGDGTEGATAGTGQDGANGLGKLLRIDPLDPDGTGSATYSIPGHNPFVGDASALDEIYALGFRNPHNFSFAEDSVGDVHLFVADIGHGSVEEVNLVHITHRDSQSGNYGWGLREGTFRRGNFKKAHPLPDNDGDINDFVYPVAQYGHHPRSETHALAGGYTVQNGSALDGYYIFGDFSFGDSPFFAFALSDALDATLTGDPDELKPVNVLTIDVVFDHDDDPDTPSVAMDSFLDIVQQEDDSITRTDLRFGQGADGELYLLNKRNGWVYLVSNSLRGDAGAAAPGGDQEADF